MTHNKICLILGIIILLVLICLILFFLKRPQTVEIGEIKSFEFTYSKGTMADSDVEYTLTLQDGVYTASIKPAGVPREDAKSFTVQKDFAEKLEALLEDNKVGEWNGFKKSAKRVLDGNYFKLSVCMENETELQAQGYMRWPKNYTTVKNGIDSLFAELEA